MPRANPGVPRAMMDDARRVEDENYRWFSAMKSAKRNGGRSLDGTVLYRCVEEKLDELFEEYADYFTQ